MYYVSHDCLDKKLVQLSVIKQIKPTLILTD